MISDRSAGFWIWKVLGMDQDGPQDPETSDVEPESLGLTRTGDDDFGGSAAAPVGGVVRDEAHAPPRRTLSRYVGGQIGKGTASLLVGLGLRRQRNDDGTLGPRRWRNLVTTAAAITAVIVVWTSVHVVAPGNVGVPVTLGHAGEPVGAGVRITWPFTTMQRMPTRTQNYTMTSTKGEGAFADIDDSVSVLGSDGGAAQVNATVLFRVDPDAATRLFRNVGSDYTQKIVRPGARACVRAEFTETPMVDAATTELREVEERITECMRTKIESEGLVLDDFQLRDVMLSAELQAAVDAKVAAQQNAIRQQFELLTANTRAEIDRAIAVGQADAQQILACGGTIVASDEGGEFSTKVIPNSDEECNPTDLSESDLTYAYIQMLSELAKSPGTRTLLVPIGQNVNPFFDLDGSGATLLGGGAGAAGATGGGGGGEG